MKIENMRLHVMAAYPGASWKYRVTRMPDRQVVAIFKNLNERKEKKPEYNEEEYHQMTIFEL